MSFARIIVGSAHRLGLILAALTACCGLSAVPASAQTKIATLSLKSYGFTTKDPPGGSGWKGEIVVGRQGRVYIGLPIWALAGTGTSKTRPMRSALRVLAAHVDDKGVTVDRVWDFPTASLNRLDLRLSSDGSPLVLAGDRLMRLGPDGAPVKTLATPSHAGSLDTWDVDTSPSGRTLRLHLQEKQSLFVNSESLAVIARCRERDDLNDTGLLTDDLELGSFVRSVEPELTYSLEQQEFCRPRTTVKAFGSIDFVPQPLDDSRFIAIRAESLSLMTLAGGTVWTSPAPQNRTLPVEQGAARLSRDGARIAVRLLRQVPHQEVESTRVKYEDVDSGVAVWATVRGRLLANVPLEPGEEDDDGAQKPSFALGPDGRLLAVMIRGVVTLWELK